MSSTKTSRLGKIALGTVMVGAVVIPFAAMSIVKNDQRTLSVGDTAGCYGPSCPAGSVEILSIDGETATVKTQAGEVVTVKTAELAER